VGSILRRRRPVELARRLVTSVVCACVVLRRTKGRQVLPTFHHPASPRRRGPYRLLVTPAFGVLQGQEHRDRSEIGATGDPVTEPHHAERARSVERSTRPGKAVDRPTVAANDPSSRSRHSPCGRLAEDALFDKFGVLVLQIAHRAGGEQSPLRRRAVHARDPGEAAGNGLRFPWLYWPLA